MVKHRVRPLDGFGNSGPWTSTRRLGAESPLIPSGDLNITKIIMSYYLELDAYGLLSQREMPAPEKTPVPQANRKKSRQPAPGLRPGRQRTPQVPETHIPRTRLKVARPRGHPRIDPSSKELNSFVWLNKLVRNSNETVRDG